MQALMYERASNVVYHKVIGYSQKYIILIDVGLIASGWVCSQSLSITASREPWIMNMQDKNNSVPVLNLFNQ